MVTISNAVPGLAKLLIFSWCLCFASVAQSEANDMNLSLPAHVKEGHKMDLSLDDLHNQVPLNTAIEAILNSDLKARKSILDGKLPDDLAGREFIEKLIDYANVRLIKDAERLVQLYENGDEVWAFESKSDLKKSKGFLLMRQGEVIHVIILELIII